MDTASRRIVSCALWLAAAVAGTFPAGCTAPPATVELVNVARQALADASELADARRADDLARLDELAAALDIGFDADVRLVAAGGLAGADGKPVALSAEWVISARKGYAAARGALADQRTRRAAECAREKDNMAAAGEALEMTVQLILQQYAVGERLRNLLLSAQRRIVHEQPADE